MEESPSSVIMDGRVTGIAFSLATRQEICKSSISDCAINHASQLSNPFLGLPLEIGKCESCGASEPGQCEGHFGYIELPIPIYHPDHVDELKRILSLLCLKCLKLKTRKGQAKNAGVLERMLASCCKGETDQVSVNEVKTADGASYLELKVPSRIKSKENQWSFLERYGFRYSDGNSRILLPSEVMAILKKLPEDTKKKLSAKGHVPQEGFILQYLPVPPNCLSVPDVSDGITIMSTDYSISLLKKVLKQIEIIKTSRSGMPNFEAHHIEANDLQAAVAQYFQFRGTGKAARDVDPRFGVSKESNPSSTKAWLEKMKTLFIRKGSGFSSRSVITGDPYKAVNEIGLPSEIAQRITFEERVNQHNMAFLQKLVDMKLCLTYTDGSSAYSLREGSKGHTFLRPGQVVHRRIMDGDIVFINRPPTTHKHSLQALSVYIHDDHTVKINPLICAPLSADFDGDCIHLFYPQSPAARAEVVELFSVEKQLLSSHTGNFNLQIVTDYLLSLKLMFRRCFFQRPQAQQLAMYVPSSLPMPTIFKSCGSCPSWTALQILQTALPPAFNCSGERYMIRESEITSFDFSMDAVQAVLVDIITSILLSKGPKEVLGFFNSVSPMLMENVYSEGFSVCLEDFYVPRTAILDLQDKLQNENVLLALKDIRANKNDSMQFQLDTYLRAMKMLISKFVLESSGMGLLVDSRSDSAISKIVQQIGFLGIQLSSRGKFYTETLVREVAELFQQKYPSDIKYPCEEFGLVRSCLFYGLDPYQEMVHSISSREVIVRSSRGLTEPGTLFKNLMAILRDVVICYDGTVRNVCSNSIVQFQYGFNHDMFQSEFGSGEPVGVLAATAMSNPAYKAVLDSSPSSNSSWEMMKEILLCPVNFRNDTSDRRVLLYLNDCACGRKHCRESASCVVRNQLLRMSLKDVAEEFLIEYGHHPVDENSEIVAGLVGHIHLDERLLKSSDISMSEVLAKCEDRINSFRKRKKVGFLFKKLILEESDCCTFQHSSKSNPCGTPCLRFIWLDTSGDGLEWVARILADTICPVLLETIVKGDSRISAVNIIWIHPETPTWIRTPSKGQRAELALDIVVEKDAIKGAGDAWRIVMDACLPVLHLIDTRRSIPYAIKQVQELLGISCAFEQAVQRLSTSVMMVTKGVLKEHLVLLANSMTCSGNLIGFNMGGIKALSKSLNMQIPFTEATLSAPRKCFERAAEKCHVDKLSSIVASCSWGKQVAVGTGSSFDILLDTKKIQLNQPGEVDVYEFLHLVRSSLDGEETSTACIGADFGREDDYEDLELSPLRDSEKPTFEDAFEFDDNKVESDWEKASHPNSQSSGGWDNGGNIGGSQGTAGWGNATNNSSWNQSAPQSSWGKKDNDMDGGSMPSRSPVGWDKSGNDEGSQPSAGWGDATKNTTSSQSASLSSWGRKVATPLDSRGKEVENDGNSRAVAQVSSWGTPSGAADRKGEEDSQSSGGWDNGGNIGGSQGTAGWGNATNNSSWNQSASQSSWGKKDNDMDGGSMPSRSPVGWDKSGNDEGSQPSAGWGDATNNTTSSQSASLSSWGRKVATPLDSRGKEVENDGNSRAVAQVSIWGTPSGAADRKGEEDSSLSPWVIKVSAPLDSWGKEVGNNVNSRAVAQVSSWGTPSGAADRKGEEDSLLSPGGRKVATPPDSWGKGVENDGNSRAVTQVSSWGTPSGAADRKGEEDSSLSPWGRKVATPIASWGKEVDNDGNSRAATQVSSWGTPSGDADRKGEEDCALPKSSQDGPPVHEWGGKDHGFSSGKEPASVTAWGGKRDPNPSNNGEWKNARNRPVKSVDHATAGLTKTRQRLDLFTSDEQEILSDVEPIMEKIRRIMNRDGYNDGDPLSAEDQAYIVENVLNHHPEKTLKIGAGINYVMVSKHGTFQESRCLYVVSTDELKQDFSYRKSLENYIHQKYPDKAEAFIAKYFRKPQPRPGWSRGGGSTPDVAVTPRGQPRRGWTRGWNKEPDSAPDEAGTPREQSRRGWKRGWNKEPDATNDEAGNSSEQHRPSWNKGWAKGPDTTPDETGTPSDQTNSGWQKGWGKGPDTASDEKTGTPSEQTNSGWQKGWGKGPDTASDEKTGTPSDQTNSGWQKGWGKGPDTASDEKTGTPSEQTNSGWQKGWGKGPDTASDEKTGTPSEQTNSGWEKGWGKEHDEAGTWKKD